MLTIRRGQFQLFEQEALKGFVDRTVLHCRSRFDRKLEDTDEEQLRDFITNSIHRASKYDVLTEYDVRRYIECAVQFGANFDKSPETAWVGKILRNQALTGREKMDQIDDHQTFALR